MGDLSALQMTLQEQSKTDKTPEIQKQNPSCVGINDHVQFEN